LDDDESIVKYYGSEDTSFFWWMSTKDFYQIFEDFNGGFKKSRGYVVYKQSSEPLLQSLVAKSPRPAPRIKEGRISNPFYFDRHKYPLVDFKAILHSRLQLLI
jgi:hypothetical protein